MMDLKSQVSYSEDIRTVMKRDLFGEQNDAHHQCEECSWNIGVLMNDSEDGANFYVVSCLFCGI